MKLLADALEEDRRATCEEFSRATGEKCGTKTHNNQPQMLVAWPLILHDNARSHIADVVTKKTPYSPDMSPPDFDLFSNLKEPMRGRRFSSL